MRACVIVLVVVLVAGSVSRGQDEARKAAADRVLSAFKAKDADALRAAAEKDKPDPWQVADELCFRGEHDAAAAFAKAAPRLRTQGLTAYVESCRDRAPDEAARKLRREVDRAYARRAYDEMLQVIGDWNAPDSTVVSLDIQFTRAIALRGLQRAGKSADAFLKAGEQARRLGWLRRATICFRVSGNLYAKVEDWRNGALAFERLVALPQPKDRIVELVVGLSNLGYMYYKANEHARAIAAMERCLELAQTVEVPGLLAPTVEKLAFSLIETRQYERALTQFERLVRIHEEGGNRELLATALNNVGHVHRRLLNLEASLRAHDRALKLRLEDGEPLGIAGCYNELAKTYLRLGQYARALSLDHRALDLAEKVGDKGQMAYLLSETSVCYGRLGDHRRAMRLNERSLKLKEELGDQHGITVSLSNLGVCCRALGEHDRAFAYLRRALARFEQEQDHDGMAACLGNLGFVHRDRGEYREAIALYERSLKLLEDCKNRAFAARTLGNLGNAAYLLGDYRRARSYRCRAVDLAGEVGVRDAAVLSMFGLARIDLAEGKAREAADRVRRSLVEMRPLVGGLAHGGTARARERWNEAFEVGIRAGLALDDPAEAYFFVESGRAGSLLQALGGREAIGNAPVPEELRTRERAARRAVNTARDRLSQARRGGKRKEIVVARSALNEADERLLEVIDRIQHEARAAADVVHPTASPLAELQALLRDEEALLLYVLTAEEAAVLVLTRKAARIVKLGATKDVETASAALSAGDVTRDPTRAIRSLRAHLIEPPRLTGKTTRLLISPHGVLAEVPFTLLAPEHEVVMVPSGTTYGVLQEELAKRGKRVLALGDPDYGVEPDPHSVTVMRSGSKLSPLPASRKETEAVADVVLLDKRATKSTLTSELHEVERWRAVHFACHGLIRTDQPQLSSLALTPDEDNDGFLTVLDVFRMRIPADLVVLSACETAKGKVYKAEGVIGFTRAFMMAGAPRVIVSLWKVDDEATRALMVKFYELWNPKNGSKGLPTATALKTAQEFVASHEKWKHPYYWAAWQLWGLPD